MYLYWKIIILFVMKLLYIGLYISRKLTARKVSTVCDRPYTILEDIDFWRKTNCRPIVRHEINWQHCDIKTF